MATQAQVKQYMEIYAAHAADSITGEVNRTALAEWAAWDYDRDEWLDDSQHWIWRLAAEVAEEFEKQVELGDMGLEPSDEHYDRCR